MEVRRWTAQEDVNDWIPPAPVSWLIQKWDHIALSRWIELKRNSRFTAPNLLIELRTQNPIRVQNTILDNVVVRRVGFLSSLKGCFWTTDNRYSANSAVEWCSKSSDDSTPVSGDIDQSNLKTAAFSMTLSGRDGPRTRVSKAVAVFMDSWSRFHTTTCVLDGGVDLTISALAASLLD